MSTFAETERLILREILPSDAEAMLELESDPEVMQYMHGNIITNIEQAKAEIASIRKQYNEDRISRWAVIERQTNTFIGISGLRIVKELRNGHQNYHSVGYRFIKRYWGKGFATEAAIAVIRYGFEMLGLNDIYATTTLDNIASKKVLEKSGLHFAGEFDYHGHQETWYHISRIDWLNSR